MSRPRNRFWRRATRRGVGGALPPAHQPAEPAAPAPEQLDSQRWLPSDYTPVQHFAGSPVEPHDPSEWVPLPITPFEPRTGAPAEPPGRLRRRRWLPWRARRNRRAG